MFKGLRTKIESEQKVQTGTGVTNITISLPQESNPTHSGAVGTAPPQDQILSLSDQLKTVMREKDECIDQNSQLYQLIEKLRRNLESEREENSSLKTKLNELDTKLKEKDDTRLNDRATSISIKAFSQSELPNSSQGDELDVLRQEVIDLQAQLAKSNRLLKIKQQNFNDLKRTLQKELLDHGRTQAKLKELQKRIDEQDILIKNKASEAQFNPQNGSSSNEFDKVKDPKHDYNQNTDDKSQNLQISSSHRFTPSGINSKISAEDNISLSAMGSMQLDRLSYLSQSSTSVDEFDSNDIDQMNTIRGVNHEYLKNVLFRYMTSTDNETTQHLIKAISVLMEFSPDQLAAIKNVMQTRSSWLRLK